MQSAGKELINQLSNLLYFELLRTFLINVFTHENRNLVTKMYFFFRYLKLAIFLE